MPKKSYKRGEIAQRVYKLLHRNPDLTSKEVGALMPDVNEHTVASNISRMVRDGKLASRGAKSEKGPNGHSRTHKTYYVKYARKPKPVVEAPKLLPVTSDAELDAEIAALIRGWAEEPATVQVMEAPKVQTMPPVSKAFEDAYSRLAILHTETMAELAETKKQLDRSSHNDCWWCKLKGKFA